MRQALGMLLLFAAAGMANATAAAANCTCEEAVNATAAEPEVEAKAEEVDRAASMVDALRAAIPLPSYELANMTANQAYLEALVADVNGTVAAKVADATAAAEAVIADVNASIAAGVADAAAVYTALREHDYMNMTENQAVLEAVVADVNDTVAAKVADVTAAAEAVLADVNASLAAGVADVTAVYAALREHDYTNMTANEERLRAAVAEADGYFNVTPQVEGILPQHDVTNMTENVAFVKDRAADLTEAVASEVRGAINDTRAYVEGFVPSEETVEVLTPSHDVLNATANAEYAAAVLGKVDDILEVTPRIDALVGNARGYLPTHDLTNMTENAEYVTAVLLLPYTTTAAAVGSARAAVEDCVTAVLPPPEHDYLNITHNVAHVKRAAVAVLGEDLAGPLVAGAEYFDVTIARVLPGVHAGGNATAADGEHEGSGMLDRTARAVYQLAYDAAGYACGCVGVDLAAVAATVRDAYARATVAEAAAFVWGCFPPRVTLWCEGVLADASTAAGVVLNVAMWVVDVTGIWEPTVYTPLPNATAAAAAATAEVNVDTAA